MMPPTTTKIRCEDVAELLPAYALGALDPDEAILVGGHIAACPACRAELSSYETVVGLVNAATPVASPPPPLRERVLTSATRASVADDMDPADRPADPPAKDPVSIMSRRRPILLTVGLAAAAAVLIAAVAVLAMLLVDARNDRDDAAAAERQLASYLSAGGDVSAMSALSAANYRYGVGQGSLVTAVGKPPLIVVGGCPPSGEDRTYRVWLERDGERTPVGVLTVGDEGAGWLTFEPAEPLSTYDLVGVTMVTDESNRGDLFIGRTGALTT